MTTTKSPLSGLAAADIPGFSLAGAFLEGLVSRDFDRLASSLRSDVNLRALLPPGFFEWNGASAVSSTFSRWFGDAEQYELVDAAVDEVGARLHLRWRVRLQSKRLGDGWFVIEQQAYADTDEAGRISSFSLLCSGYCPDGGIG